MKNRFLPLLGVCWTISLCGVVWGDDLQVGASQVDITPPTEFRKGGGYGEIISTGVHDPLMCKALVFRQQATSAAIVIADLLSVPEELSRRARKLASARTEIPVEHIVVAATHNHGSPEYWGVLRDLKHEAAVADRGTDPHEPIDYQSKLVDAIVESIVIANDRVQKASVDVIMARQTKLAFNRRFHMRDGSVRFNPGRGNPNIVRPAGPVDEELPILLIRPDQENAAPLASLTTFALHTAVAGGTEFTADFPAVLQTRLRDQFGGDMISLFAEGTAGDINHVDVADADPPHLLASG